MLNNWGYEQRHVCCFYAEVCGCNVCALLCYIVMCYFDVVLCCQSSLMLRQLDAEVRLKSKASAAEKRDANDKCYYQVVMIMNLILM